MRAHSSLDALRSRRRGLLGLIALLLLNWVNAAALPCAAMGLPAGVEPADAMPAGMPVEHSHDEAHRAHGTTAPASHPACPHCAHAPQGVAGDDAAAHAACGEAPANTLDDSRRSPAKQDLGVAVPIAAQSVAALRAADLITTRDPHGVPPPTRALYLTHCVFLN